jgi:Dullard-like phosphatase family protein
MSKLFSGKRYFLKPIKQPNNNDSYANQSMQDIIDSYTKNQPGISNNFSSFNKNNITVDYPKHYSPSYRSPVSLPPISGKNRRSNNSQKKPVTKKLGNSNSSTNLYSQSLFGPAAKKQLEREKTQINLIENTLEQNKNNLSKLNNMAPIEKMSNGQNLNNITQINNITNINIHIYQNNTNKTVDNVNKDEINIQKNDAIIPETSNFSNNNDTMNSLQNPLFKIKPNKINSSASLIGNAGMSIISPNLNNLNINSNIKKNNNLNNIYSKNDKNKKTIKGNIRIMPSNSSSIYTNKSISNSLSSIGSMIMNSNNNSSNNIKIPSSRGISQNKVGNNNKYTNSLPDINMGRSSSISKKVSNLDNDLINILKEENNNLNTKDLENIDLSMNFLKDLSTNNSTFIAFLQLIQTHMDIELFLDSTENNGNNLFRRKMVNTINNEKINKLNNLLNTYFNTLSLIYIRNSNNPTNAKPIDNFFLYQSINIVFHKCIKIQICLFSSILVTISQLGIYEINTMIKNHFHQIIKEISNPLLNIFETFIKEEINLNYPELITINLRPDFNDHYNKLHKIQKFTHNYKNSELISLISKNLDKCVNSMKYYSTLNLKYSTIKPFGDALNQLLFSLDRKTLLQFANIALKTLLFGELDANKNRSMQNCMASNINLNKNMNNISMGSSIINNIKDFPPFLPPINPKYKYTLVLDMDETLIHYFFTHITGMFFVRPYCFDFLRELNELYEIVTFTAGTKDYADNILNILDIDNNIIKYRLYRQHTTMLGCSVYKDLSKLGRDLSKVIFIDNLKENFKMQPNNGIFIKTWTNDINDVQFKDLLKILKEIVAYNVTDVRPLIQKMNDEIKISRNMIRPYGNINISKLLG